MNKYDKVVIKLKNQLMADVNRFKQDEGISPLLVYAAGLLDKVEQWIHEAKMDRWQQEYDHLKSRLVDARFSEGNTYEEVVGRIEELETLINGEDEEETKKPARKLNISK